MQPPKALWEKRADGRYQAKQQQHWQFQPAGPRLIVAKLKKVSGTGVVVGWQVVLADKWALLALAQGPGQNTLRLCRWTVWLYLTTQPAERCSKAACGVTCVHSQKVRKTLLELRFANTHLQRACAKQRRVRDAPAE